MSKSDYTALTAESFRARFHYDPLTGIITRRVDRANQKRGSIAGSLRQDGYWTVVIDWKRYLHHRLAWLYVHGTWPTHLLDHRDGNPSNNALSNLREATYQTNNQNKRVSPSNVCGYKGVSRNNKGWSAFIKINRKTVYLGYFATPEDAHAAYCAAAKQHYGEFFNPG